ncbi:MAG: dTDP-glucose 4,6-dehydratase [Acidobacteriota bacterium]
MKRSNRKLNNILVTGGAGFIGSNFIRYLLLNKEFNGKIINVDKLTYAGNKKNLKDIEEKFEGDRYFFKKTDICNRSEMERIVKFYNIDTVVHFAAESHVDRSITGPEDFIQTNIVGTFILIDILKDIWAERNDVLFHHISTDEVYGSLGSEGKFFETTPYDPKSPYSASKASSDHLVRAYSNTYDFPCTISNCSNNYGPFQFPEKLIPLMINNAMNGEKLPVYGDGGNIRDWLYVEDHCSAVWKILNNGKIGETYNIGGDCEKKNIDLVKELCRVMDETFPVSDNPALRENNPELESYGKLITFVKDRPGHDRRYAVNCEKIKEELNWAPSVTFKQGLKKTLQWYLDNM